MELACPSETWSEQLAPVSVRRSLLAVYRLSARLRGFCHSDVTYPRYVSTSALSELQPSFRVRPVTERPRSQRKPRRTLAADHDFLPGGFIPYSVFPHAAAAFLGWVCLAQPPAPSGFLNLLTPNRPMLAGLISCRIRSWGSLFRALFLPSSRSPFPTPMPSCCWTALFQALSSTSGPCSTRESATDHPVF